MARQKEQRLIEILLKKVRVSYGDDPFLIIAKNRLSVILGASDDFAESKIWSFSHFQPDDYTIRIDRTLLDEFWREMFPGCPHHLKYRYACWREIWHFWIYQRFATVKCVLQQQIPNYISTFADQPKAKQNYCAHYLAGMATGLIQIQPKQPTYRHAGNVLV